VDFRCSGTAPELNAGNIGGQLCGVRTRPSMMSGCLPSSRTSLPCKRLRCWGKGVESLLHSERDNPRGLRRLHRQLAAQRSPPRYASSRLIHHWTLSLAPWFLNLGPWPRSSFIPYPSSFIKKFSRWPNIAVDRIMYLCIIDAARAARGRKQGTICHLAVTRALCPSVL
jgi:hypothetical protein